METITFEGRTVTVDPIGYPIDVPTGVRCGCCSGRHENAKAVKFCFVIVEEQVQTQKEEQAAELAVERYFEDRGYWDNVAHDEWERSRGVVGFTEAWHIESPDTCPCDAH